MGSSGGLCSSLSEALLGIPGLWNLLPGHIPGLSPQGREALPHTVCHLSGHQWLPELPMLIRLCEA